MPVRRALLSTVVDHRLPWRRHFDASSRTSPLHFHRLIWSPSRWPLFTPCTSSTSSPAFSSRASSPLRFADTDKGADVGGAPKGCVRSLRAFTAAIAASADAPRRRSCSCTPRAITRRARVRASGTALRSRIVPRPGSVACAAAELVRGPASGGRVGAPRRAHAPWAGRAQKHDLRPPPAPAAVALGLVLDQAGRLKVVEPALHALSMRSDEARPRSAGAWHRPPPNHWREPDDELRERRRVARRRSRVAEPEQVALDRVGPGLQPIVAGRRAATPETRARPSMRIAPRAAARRQPAPAQRPAAPPAPGRAARSSSLADRRSRRSWEAHRITTRAIHPADG